jgi:FxLD family lantipeptide
MTPAASLADLAPPAPADGGPHLSMQDFQLDLRIIESATALAVVRCATDDNCGSTCAPSACSTESSDPF